MLKIGLFPNLLKKEVLNSIDLITNLLKECGLNIILYDNKTNEVINRKNIDIAISIGGDGTMIKNIRELSKHNIPVFGINMGRIGFLNEIELKELKQVGIKLFNKEYTIEKRIMTKINIYRNLEKIFSDIALNDVVICKTGFLRLLRSFLYINENFIESYPADGVIIATPTGSTGYALSAGGPIISPSLNVLTIIPICPHLLHIRPIIIPSKEKIKVTFEPTEDGAELLLDGQVGFPLKNNDTIEITQAKYQARFLKFSQNKSFYEAIRTKLHLL